METQDWVALSAIVAAASFVFAVLTRRKAERDAELRGWQRVVIYSLLEEQAPLLFEELREKYLKRARELLSRNAPKKVIQDDSLKRVLLDLQKDGVIVRTQNLSYQVQVKLPVDAWALEEFKRMQRARLLKPKLRSMIEGRDGERSSIWVRR